MRLTDLLIFSLATFVSGQQSSDPDDEDTADTPPLPYGKDNNGNDLCVVPRGEKPPDCYEDIKQGNGWGQNDQISGTTIAGLPDLTSPDLQRLCNSTGDVGRSSGVYYQKFSNNYVVYGHGNGCCWATLGKVWPDGDVIRYSPCYLLSSFPGDPN